MSQEITRSGGRPRLKFTPANLQKIKDLVAQGMGREEIASSLDVTLGSLQVTCSRLGISLRRRDNAPRDRSGAAFLSNNRAYRAHSQREPASRAKFQMVLVDAGYGASD